MINKRITKSKYIELVKRNYVIEKYDNLSDDMISKVNKVWNNTIEFLDIFKMLKKSDGNLIEVF